MNEWSVIVMLITLGGGIIALVRPIVTLTKAITELTVTCKNLDGQFAAMQNKNTESHRRIWEAEGTKLLMETPGSIEKAWELHKLTP